MIGKLEKLFILVLAITVAGYIAVFYLTIRQNSAVVPSKVQSSAVVSETPENGLQTRIDIYRYHTVVYSGGIITELYIDLERYPVLDILCDYIVSNEEGHNCLLESKDKIQSTLQHIRQ